MKSSLLLFAVLSIFVGLNSCKDEKKAETTPSTEQAPAQNPNAGATPADLSAPQGTPPANVTPPATATPEAPQNAKGVWHFTCSKGCPGGAGTQSNCAKCNNPLTHNPAYHTN
ncbi:MAG: hypothetical protein WAR77_10620 [Saprospiraceae bacterium]